MKRSIKSCMAGIISLCVAGAAFTSAFHVNDLFMGIANIVIAIVWLLVAFCAFVICCGCRREEGKSTPRNWVA